MTGDSVNLAARLTDLAKPTETLVSASVQRALGERFVGEPFGEQLIDGLPEPISVWQLRDISSVQDGSASHFVGRSRELHHFTAAINHCLDRKSGETIVVRGEAGIGKSRLAEEFQTIATQKGFLSHAGLVLDFGTAKGQDAIRALVRSLLGITPGSGKDIRTQQATKVIGGLLLQDHRRVYLNDLLDLSQPPDLRGLYDAMDNKTRNRGKQETVAELIEAISRKTPLLLKIEDLHWADSVVLAHAASMARAVMDCPALLVLTTRIADDPLEQAWRAGTDGSSISAIDLGPLKAEEASDLSLDFPGLDEELVQNCIARAGGNPLFLEQLLRNADELDRGDIPGTVQGIVQARLDALTQADREALQAASVLGQRFSRPAMNALMEADDYDLTNLMANALIRPAGDDFHFAHALIRDGVYASLLKPRRIELHSRAAAWFRDADLVLHAEHLDKAEDRRAAKAYLEAAKQQAQSFRYDTAFRLIERALQHDSDSETRFELSCTQGDLLRDLGRTEESITAFQHALDTAQDEDQACQANIGLSSGIRVVDRFEEAFDALDTAEQRAGGSALHLASIHYLRGNCHFPFGRSAECLEEHRKSLQYVREAQLVRLEGQALSGISDALYIGRRFNEWRESLTSCFTFSDQHQLHALRATTLYMRATSSIWHLALQETIADAERSAVIAKQIGDQRSETSAEAIVSIGQY